MGNDGFNLKDHPFAWLWRRKISVSFSPHIVIVDDSRGRMADYKLLGSCRATFNSFLGMLVLALLVKKT